MTQEINDGGSAYPVNGRMHGDQLGGQLSHGMSLRDYFAGQVLASGKWSYGLDSSGATAAACYQIADAMLAERVSDK